MMVRATSVHPPVQLPCNSVACNPPIPPRWVTRPRMGAHPQWQLQLAEAALTIEAALTGRVGNPPERRTARNGKPWASFSVAAEQQEEGAAEWVQIAVFDPLLDELPADIQKGERIYVEGKLRLNRWDGSEGPRARLQVSATRIVVLERIGRRRKPARKAVGTAQLSTSSDVADGQPATGEPV